MQRHCRGETFAPRAPVSDTWVTRPRDLVHMLCTHKRHPSDAFDVISIRLVGRGYDGVHGGERYRYIDMGYGILIDIDNSKKLFHFAFCEEVGIGGVQRLIHFFSLQVYHRENRINFLCEIITKKLNKTEKQPPERRTKN